MLTMASATGWTIGIVLGVVVIAVAALIVITIVALSRRIAGQAATADEAVETVRVQTDGLDGVSRINDSGVRILHSARALRKAAVGSDRRRNHRPRVLDDRTDHRPRRRARRRRPAPAMLLMTWPGSRARSMACSRPPEKVGANTAHIPELEATAPVLAQIVDEAVVQDGYMNALTDGFGDAEAQEEVPA